MRSIDPLIDRLTLLTEHISHPGERGRLAELILSEWLRTILPNKYSIGTGFIAAIDNNQKLQLSSQQDIIIYDNHHCTPLWKTEIGGLYPIESVYATIEVKTTLTKGAKPTKKRGKDSYTPHKGLYKCFSDIKRIRELAQYKSYLELDKNQSIATFRTLQSSSAPRSYIVAYNIDEKIETLDKLKKTVKSIIDTGAEYDTHYHGITILNKNKDWFVRRPHCESEDGRAGVVCEGFDKNGWEFFAKILLPQLESMDVNEHLNKHGHVMDRNKYPVSF